MRSGTPYQQNRRMSAIEAFDSRQVRSGLAFRRMAPGRSDRESEARPNRSRSLADVAAKRTGRRDRTEIPCVKLPKPAGEDQAGEFPQVFDAGAIVSGWPKIALRGIAGATVRLRYSEDLDENGRVKHNVTNEFSDNYYDEYTMRGDELETWQPDFSFKAFRYVEVTDIREKYNPEKSRFAGRTRGWLMSAALNAPPIT